MLKLENFEVMGWDHAIRGMRNPMNSWEQSDSDIINATLKKEEVCPGVEALVSVPCKPYTKIGPNDHDLMMRLRKAGTDHRKFMRMITVYVDITTPLYWWKEFDTYKVGTVANSCSTMHKIHEKPFTRDDFSHDHLFDECEDDTFVAYPNDEGGCDDWCSISLLDLTVCVLNEYRNKYIETKDKKYWWQMIQLLPSSYNQKRTVMLNYEVLANIYKSRKNHKLDEWHAFCDWIEGLPYSEIIIGEVETNDKANG